MRRLTYPHPRDTGSRAAVVSAIFVCRHNNNTAQGSVFFLPSESEYFCDFFSSADNIIDSNCVLVNYPRKAI